MNTSTTHNTTTQGSPAINRASMPALAWSGPLARHAGHTAAPDAPWRASAAQWKDAPAPWEAVAARRRRWLLFGVVGATLFATSLQWRSQVGVGSDVLLTTQLVLFALLFAWVSAGTVTAVMGFWVMLRGDQHAMSARSAKGVALAADARTALIMPICNEDVATVFAGLRATCESLVSAGAARVFDVFVLSDTSDPDLRIAELSAWKALREQLRSDGTALQVHYRWRQRRTRRKAGNVADFCRRWGRCYRYMVVLDADSVMTGDTLVTLARLMEAHPRAGIIQTAPRTCGHSTLHARAQQFGSRVTGRLFTAGMQFWQLGEAHYWGHNAIIRVAPFMEHCGLASLPGKGALGGEIMSHDFVEAALMRRAGYEVWLVDDLEGSYEQQPPHLLAELQRDRRWCGGNLQNARLLTEPGLRPVHRAMLATGAMAYLSAPLWLLYVVLGACLWLHGSELAPWSNQGVLMLWASTVTMLALPRALGLATVILRKEQNQFGGYRAMVGSAFLEATLSIVQAPLRMVAHSLFVLGAVTGWALDWKSPPREAVDLKWREASQAFGGLSLGVLCLLFAIGLWSLPTVAWLLPIGLPLLLAVPYTVLSSRAGAGQWLRQAGWLLVPEEKRAPTVLQRAETYSRERGAHVPASAWIRDLPRLASLALHALGPRHTGLGLRGQMRRQQVLQWSRHGNPTASASEKMRFLNEPHSLRMLHAALVGQHFTAASSPR